MFYFSHYTKQSPRRESRSGALLIGGGGGTVDPRLSMRPGLCLHPSWDAGRVIRCIAITLTLALSRRERGLEVSLPKERDEIIQRILVSAPSSPNQRTYESLQGREGWPFSTPRRCHAVRYQDGVRVHRYEPRFHSALASRGDHCVNRTRVRKSYSSGSTCVVCLRFDSAVSGRQDPRRAEPAMF